MSTITMRNETAAKPAKGPAQTVDLKLEVVVIPVSDVERSKGFYGALGWRLDADFPINEALHLVQFTPPGSACSIHFGKGVTSASPGSAKGLFLVVSDIIAARDQLVERGAKVSEIFHRGPGQPPAPGVHPARQTYSSYATFNDPDGNEWLLQEVTARLPGRVDPDDTVFTSSSELAAAFRRAEAAHGEHERRLGQKHADWAPWYAEYIVNEQAGKPLPA